MFARRDRTEAAERSKERRERDDASPRLREEVPGLTALHLEVTVSRRGSAISEGKSIRRFVVATAPARFALTCTDPDCKDGGHDLTDVVMRALRSGRKRFETEDACRGTAGSANCDRVLHVVGIAAYRDDEGPGR